MYKPFGSTVVFRNTITVFLFYFILLTLLPYLSERSIRIHQQLVLFKYSRQINPSSDVVDNFKSESFEIAFEILQIKPENLIVFPTNYIACMSEQWEYNLHITKHPESRFFRLGLLPIISCTLFQVQGHYRVILGSIGLN